MEQEFQEVGIQILTPITLDELIKKNGTIVCLFFSPKCPHCHAMKNEYIKLYKRLKSRDIVKEFDIDIVAINGDIYDVWMIENYNITGYPTIVIIDEYGNKCQIDGPYTVQSILESMIT